MSIHIHANIHDCYDREITVTRFTNGIGTSVLLCATCLRERPVPEYAPEPEEGDIVTEETFPHRVCWRVYPHVTPLIQFFRVNTVWGNAFVFCNNTDTKYGQAFFHIEDAFKKLFGETE